MAFPNFFKADNFLGIYKLESGGIIIGAVGIFWALQQLITEIILLFALFCLRDFCPQRYFISDETYLENFSNETQHEIKNFTNYAQHGLQNITHKVQEGINDVTGNEVSCTFVSKIPIIAVLVLAILVNILSIIAHNRLIKGIEELNPARFQLARVFYQLFIVIRVIFLAIVAIWTFFWLKMFLATILFLFLFYIDFYIYSVIDKLSVKYEKSIPLSVEAQNIQLKRKVPRSDLPERVQI
nr:transmembrane protein LIL10 [Polypedilum vanderplanki]